MKIDWDEAYMEPEEFVRLTGATHEDLADICNVSDVANVRKWFTKGKSYRPPNLKDKRILYLAYRHEYVNN
jgi:hypothetical protein